MVADTSTTAVTGLRDTLVPVERALRPLRYSGATAWRMLLPAQMEYAYPTNLTAVALLYQYDQRNKLLHFDQGRVGHLAHFLAHSYLHLRQDLTVYGMASYSYGRIKGMKWMNSSDLQETYPYISATQEGGEGISSTYRFMGGADYRLPFGTLGLVVAYRAMQYHRIRDPRPRNIVSDFNLQLAYSIPIADFYTLGLAGALRIYKQSSSVTTFNPQSEPEYFLFKGLGSVFRRKDVSDSPILYRMRGGGATLQLRPIGGQGFWVKGALDYSRLERLAVRANVAPINHYLRPYWSASLGYSHWLSAWELGAVLETQGEVRQGFDHILGGSGIKEYKDLLALPNYTSSCFAAALRLAAEYNSRAGMAYAAQGDLQREQLNEPFKEVRTAYITQQLQGYYRFDFLAHSLRLGGSLEFGMPISQAHLFDVSLGSTRGAAMDYVRHNVAIRTYYHLGGLLEVIGHFSIRNFCLLEVGLWGKAGTWGLGQVLEFSTGGNVGIIF